MPLHYIYTPPGLYSKEDKRGFAKEITDWYTAEGLPEFYVIVMFIEVPSDSFFVGTANHDERTRDFRPHVTWNIEHLAGQTNTQAHKLSLVKKMKPIGKKYLGDRGYDWEITISEPAQDLWTVNGDHAPALGDPDLKLWKKANQVLPLTSKLSRYSKL